MSSQSLLKLISGGGPILDFKYAIPSAPVRQIFMMGLVWNISRARPGAGLNILEIGSWYGSSALSWAEGLKLHNEAQGTLTCVDGWAPFQDLSTHPDDFYSTQESVLATETAYNIFLHNIRTVPKTIKCQHVRGPSQQVLPLLARETFDIVFIDADHTYEPVKEDIRASIPLVRDGGILCGDDLNLQWDQVDQEHVKVNSGVDFVREPKTGRNYHPGVTLAVHEAFGPVASWGGFWAVRRRGLEWEAVSLANMPVHIPSHFPPEAVERAKSHLADIQSIA